MMSESNELDNRACEREAIHAPGSIQPHGVLLVVDPTSGIVLQAAGDTASLLGYPGSVLGKTVVEILGARGWEALKEAEAELLQEPTHVGTIAPEGGDQALTITAHKIDGVVVVELEPAGPQVSAASALAQIRLLTERIAPAPTLDEACRVAVREVRRITGLDRVLIYRFLTDGSGAVLAEDKHETLQSFLNHRFPASDIPQQARDLYRRNAVRAIADVAYQPAPLNPPLRPPTGRPLDMSYCALRSISPVHVQYLKNMGVGASMSVSILVHGELWGLVACHNTVARRLPYEDLEAFRHVGQILAQQIRTSEEADRHRGAADLAAARDRVMRALVNSDEPRAAFLKVGDDLTDVARARGIAVIWKDTVTTAGHVPSEAEVRKLAAWVSARTTDGDVFATDRLAEAYADSGALGPVAAGLLATALPGEHMPVLMWFRPEQVEEINWAGNPHKPMESGESRVGPSPRKSFATWRETVRNRSHAWTATEIGSVEGLRTRLAFVLQQQSIRELNELLTKANEQLSVLAATDGLTGVANRRVFDERLISEWKRCGRLKIPLALIILDLDFFKQYNDAFGHLAGDDCLKRVARVLADGRRTSDLAARFGGEEFCLLLPDTGIQGATTVADSVRSGIQALGLAHPANPTGVVTASLGVAALLPAEGGSAQDLVGAADKALYDAKSRGRNRVCQG
jgi:diguanylate cyclase (GGDEF)-like protein